MTEEISLRREKSSGSSTAELRAPFRLFLLFTLVFFGIYRNFQTLVPLFLLLLFAAYIYMTE